MKTLKNILIVAIMLFSILGIACEHCDDEDYRRDEAEENNSQIHTDTSFVSSDQ